MGEALNARLKSAKFESPVHEAVLSVMLAAVAIRSNFDKSAGDSGLTTEQYNILRILRGVHPDGHACGAIAERMIDRAPDITRRINTLEKQGLVTRAKSPTDRRIVITKITDKGLQLLEEVTPAIRQMQESLGPLLSESEWKELTRLCEKLFAMEDTEPGPEM